MQRRTLAAVLTVALMAVVGCKTDNRTVIKTEDATYVGPYTVRVYDEDTGKTIRGAVVEWIFSFASDRFDALKRRRLGVDSTDGGGGLTIPQVEAGRNDEFVELDIVVTKAGYLEARRTIKPGGFFSSNTVVFRLKPIKPMTPLR